MTTTPPGLMRATFLDQASPQEAQALAQQLQRDMEALFQRGREIVYEATSLRDAQNEIQYALDKLSLARPKIIRCPYPAASMALDFLNLSHDPALKHAKVV
ncbi:MAG TPA: hypothetical protein VJU81_08400 [Methylomirabilota bacterium]|nr:hypothetical protein [Methylomirabilota bacterium]